jgi:hypothetical protein
VGGSPWAPYFDFLSIGSWNFLPAFTLPPPRGLIVTLERHDATAAIKLPAAE